jgi:cell division protein ZapA (FtsZ GTPase activity inhibitor)
MQAMEPLIPVTVVIADRTYRLRIQAGDEEVLRKTAKTINDKVVEFKTQFAGKDMQDYIAMVLLWFATEQTSSGTEAIQKENLSDRLDALERILDGQLNQP